MDTVKILFIGDIVSQVGCDFLRKKLPKYRRDNNIDLVIANGENSAVGNGILPSSANFIFDSGVDVITTGNHVFKRREIYSYLDENPQIIRPANYPSSCNGNGYYIYDAGSYTVCVINMMGTVYLENLANPFFEIDKILKSVKANIYFIDFHAEATGEKKGFAYYLDGRVSAIVGTHTHIQTADEQILPNGTGYITDAGMTGPIQSALGINPQNIIDRFLTSMPTRFIVPETECMMNGIVFDIDKKTGKCAKVERINIV